MQSRGGGERHHARVADPDKLDDHLAEIEVSLA
jgi:hypothetical protein